MPPRGIDPAIREAALQLYYKNGSPSKTARETGISKATIDSWIRRGPGSVTDRGHKVGDIRQALDMLDAGISLSRVAKVTKHERATIRRWRDMPSFREATTEYDPNFNYDVDNLLDRCVVARHLCTEVRCDGRFVDGPRQRLELLFAAIDYTGEAA